jgi:hypothetical protein
MKTNVILVIDLFVPCLHQILKWYAGNPRFGEGTWRPRRTWSRSISIRNQNICVQTCPSRPIGVLAFFLERPVCKVPQPFRGIRDARITSDQQSSMLEMISSVGLEIPITVGIVYGRGLHDSSPSRTIPSLPPHPPPRPRSVRMRRRRPKYRTIFCSCNAYCENA